MSVEGGSDRQQAGFVIIAAVGDLLLLLKSFCRTKYFAKVTKSCPTLKQKNVNKHTSFQLIELPANEKFYQSTFE